MGLVKTVAVLLSTACAVAVAVGAAAAFYFKDQIETEYDALLKPLAHLNIDAFTGGPASFPRKLQVVATERLTGASEFPIEASLEKTVKLGWTPSPHVEGLRVTTAGDGIDEPDAKALVVATIRMGFGHQRIAYAASSWAVAAKKHVYFHDLLSIESAEARLVHDTDKLYRKSSKLATEVGGPFELIHGFLTSSGDATSLRSTALVGARLAPLMKGLPRGAPVIATHTLVALAAAAAGMDNVVNLVIDNHPQWFVVAPMALNLVQGPRNYYGFLKKFEEGNYLSEGGSLIKLAGHWIPKHLVDNIPRDCDARIKRAKAREPRRVLVPVGGAGAQKKFITELTERVAPLCKSGKVKLVLNAGDHADLRASLLETLGGLGFAEGGDLKVIGDHAGVVALQRSQDFAPVTLLAFSDYFAAVAATDLLVPVVDVLACKPSELAFYPVPKLMIRRVGDHEAFSASRANELGDGTEEARTVADAGRYLDLFVAGAEPLVTMNAMIKRHAAWGAYGGCERALELAAAPPRGA